MNMLKFFEGEERKVTKYCVKKMDYVISVVIQNPWFRGVDELMDCINDNRYIFDN